MRVPAPTRGKTANAWVRHRTSEGMRYALQAVAMAALPTPRKAPLGPDIALQHLPATSQLARRKHDPQAIAHHDVARPRLGCGEVFAANLGALDLSSGSAGFSNTPIAGSFVDTLTFTLTVPSLANGSVTTVRQRQPGPRLLVGRAERPERRLRVLDAARRSGRSVGASGQRRLARRRPLYADLHRQQQRRRRFVRRQLRGDADLAGAGADQLRVDARRARRSCCSWRAAAAAEASRESAPPLRLERRAINASRT